ncbi:unnamed protein product, partial [Allacma fusca]
MQPKFSERTNYQINFDFVTEIIKKQPYGKHEDLSKIVEDNFKFWGGNENDPTVVDKTHLEEQKDICLKMLKKILSNNQ